MASPDLRKSAFIFSILAGCALAPASLDPVTASLVNKGPVTVDPQNPYLAPNQLLKTEAGKSPELAGFINLKGHPSTLELQQKPDQSLMLLFSYPAPAERYELLKAGQTWVITGPYPMEGPKASAAADAPKKPALPAIKSRKQADSAKSVTHGAFVSPQSAIPPTPPPIPSVAASPVPVTPAASISKPTPALTTTEAPASDMAEISPRGDLVHYVTLQGETLSTIARWYTEDRENAPKIARLNRLKNSNALTIGDTIIIPSYMIRNKIRLTDEALKKMLAIAEGEKVKKAKP